MLQNFCETIDRSNKINKIKNKNKIKSKAIMSALFES